MTKCYKISYLGKDYKSDNGFEIMSDQEYADIYKKWYQKPDFSKVQQEMANLRRGSNIIAEITEYYFRELMDNTVVYHSKWSINEVFANKELLSVFVDRIKRNDKVFNSDNIIDNLDTAFRLGGKGIAVKVAQFPIKAVDFVLEKYNMNNSWYDFSCGWGGRLAGAMKNKVNYFGTDPNYLLCDKLKEFANDYKRTQMGKNATITDIRCSGSEIFHKDWENKMGLAFSSPPYFSLEDYRIGAQSYTQGTTYEQWLNEWMFPTFVNIYRYLIKDGFLIVNIKDFQNYSLENDTIRIAEKAGFYLFDKETLSNNSRVASIGNGEHMMVDNDENIYVFAKRGSNPKPKVVEQQSLFDLI